jgi:hypothetical protein
MTTISWPPTDEDFIRVARSAAHTHNNFKNVLIYADNPTIMIFDPVHIGPEQRFQKMFSVTSDKVTSHFNVILSEID